ncbi:hypothetical protein SVIO_109670 [Streptomyces violaceusniger]|uniref:Uncharacterized protein n=2 Tax=Streptomyces violaceusniger TaxID=68280 RepID=A0A4D4LIQ4_STRVO|nr:hypothetical protein SVIO_109670 [Streptomyces violaceusniger]
MHVTEPASSLATSSWWGRAVLDSDPQRDRIHAAAEAGTLPTTSWDEIARRRRANGERCPVSDEPRDLWPVAPSEAVGETLADPGLSADLFSAVVALTVSIARIRG